MVNIEDKVLLNIQSAVLPKESIHYLCEWMCEY